MRKLRRKGEKETWLPIQEALEVVILNVKILSKTENEMEVVLEGEDHTLPNMLKEIAMQDSDVEFASYKIDHPKLGAPKLYIRTNGKKKPERVLSDAIKKIRKDITALKEGTSKKSASKKKK